LGVSVLDLAARAEALARVRRVQIVLALLLALYGRAHVAAAWANFKVYQRAREAGRGG